MFTRERHSIRNQNAVLRLTPVEKAALWLIAKEDGISASDVLRLGLDLYVKKRETGRQPQPSGLSADRR